MSEGSNTGGRPSKYRPEFSEQAAKLCALGATDAELANFFEVSVRTLHRWKHEDEAFCHALKVSKGAADARVERSLYQRAAGYDFVEQQAIKVKAGQEERVEIVNVERHMPPDTTAMIFWLKNRRTAEWRDRIEAPAPITLPPGSLTDQGRAVLNAAGSGQLAPSQAAQLLAGLGSLAKLQETDELERRIAELEKKHVEAR